MAALAVLALTGTQLSAVVASATSSATYTAIEKIPVPPAANYAGSGGGDGWAVALSADQVFNVFHHSYTLTVRATNNRVRANAGRTPSPTR